MYKLAWSNGTKPERSMKRSTPVVDTECKQENAEKKELTPTPVNEIIGFPSFTTMPECNISTNYEDCFRSPGHREQMYEKMADRKPISRASLNPLINNNTDYITHLANQDAFLRPKTFYNMKNGK